MCPDLLVVCIEEMCEGATVAAIPGLDFHRPVISFFHPLPCEGTLAAFVVMRDAPMAVPRAGR